MVMCAAELRLAIKPYINGECVMKLTLFCEFILQMNAFLDTLQIIFLVSYVLPYLTYHLQCDRVHNIM